MAREVVAELAEPLAQPVAAVAASWAEQPAGGPEVAEERAHWRPALGLAAVVPDGRVLRPVRRELAVNGIPGRQLVRAASRSPLSDRTLRADAVAPAFPPSAEVLAKQAE